MTALRKSITALVGGLMLAAPAFAEEAKPAAGAGTDAEAAKVNAFAEALKKQDPEAYKRFIGLREAKDKSLADLKKAQDSLKSAQGEEKMNAYQEFKAARKKYAESYIAFLNFLDERDKLRIEKIEGAIKQYQQLMEQLKGVIKARDEARKELEKALKAE